MIFIVLIGLSCNKEYPVDENVRINSLGYLPGGIKTATIIASSCREVNVRDAGNNNIIFKAEITGPHLFPDSNMVLWKADFTAFHEEGRYYLEVPGMGRSAIFPIKNDVYKGAYTTAMRAFYLWRCGTAVHGVYKGDTFAQEPCHLEDGWYDFTEFGAIQKDGTGGWHDAGDYGKYVTNAGITMANLFMTWEHFGKKLDPIALSLPQTTPGMPEFLQELKWETDFLLKMQFPDGSGRVSHKLTRQSFSGFVMPQDDKEKRYFTDWSSDATAQFAATMAMAARYFKQYDPAYALTCLEAAKRSYNFLKNHPETKPWNQGKFRTGAYQADDRFSRLWVAAELWETTGELSYLNDFEARARTFNPRVDDDWDWGNIKNLGMFTYLLSERPGKDEALYTEIRNACIEAADGIVKHTRNDPFGRPFSRYFWGCNGTVARLAINLSVANKIEPREEYIHAGQEILGHLFGRNFYGRSYVTGLGVNPPMFPHDRRSAADNVEAPWPGYLVGGGHTPTDWVDDQKSYSHNEIAINWQAPLVYLLAWFAGEGE